MSNLKTLMPVYPDILADFATKTLAVGDLIMASAVSTAGLGDPALVSVTNGLSFRNLLVNPEMKVAQRGATVTSPAEGAYTLDGWVWQNTASGAGAVTITQSTTVPNATFVNSLKVDVTTADAAIAAGDYYGLTQRIEGLRCSRLAFGGASAQPIVLSFWIRVDSAALTFPATFTGGIQNSAQNRSYPFTFSVTTNATWQKISVALSGDTTGTWLQTSGIGLRVFISFDVGSNFQGTANAWAGADDRGTSAQAAFMANTANDLYLTGCQLEVGVAATNFEYQDYAQYLWTARRYFRRFVGTVDAQDVGDLHTVSATRAYTVFPLGVVMRTSPTGTLAGAVPTVNDLSAGTIVAINSAQISGTDAAVLIMFWETNLTVAYQCSRMRLTTAATDWIDLSAEL